GNGKGKYFGLKNGGSIQRIACHYTPNSIDYDLRNKSTPEFVPFITIWSTGWRRNSQERGFQKEVLGRELVGKATALS
ncbi:MAG TPA: hypothetical protein VMV04_00315, partial [Thermodesulfobacteriota bacterium]|nr:hypothetical protein [Thermodesulfobacteriota bacterium]